MVESFDAEISSVSIADGGNPKPFGPGYRAILHYNAATDGELHSVTVDPTVELVEAGDTVLCTIRFSYPEHNNETLAKVGSRFELRDGARVRAIGLVIAVVAN